jgi:FMN phosphatase YigB (HAD superfamily)
MLSKLFCFPRSSSKNKTVDTAQPIASPAAKKTNTSSTTSSLPDAQPPQESNTGKPTRSKSRTLILDLGDVLFHYNASGLTSLSRSAFHSVILSPAWGQYERGLINEDEALEIVGKELSLEPDAIREGFDQCRKTLHADIDFYAQLRALKDEMNGDLKVYAMSNISKEDFASLKAILPDWGLFDAEFTSFEAHLIKPELGFYQHVLDKIGLADPTSAIFVDDKLLNVMAARSFGIRGIVCKSSSQVMRQLRIELFDPVARARQYMRNNARNHFSQVENSIDIRDAFSQFLIQLMLQDTSLISLSSPEASEAEIEEEFAKAKTQAKTWNYFIGPPQGTTSTFPDDVDDTAMALLAFSPPASSATPVLDQHLKIRHPRDGLVQTYFSEQRPRVCPWVLVSALRVFYHYNRGAELKHELQYVTRVLLNRAYLEGSDYYPSGEVFLYFLASLIQANPDAAELQALREPLATACRERVGRCEENDTFAVALRIVACQVLGVWAGSDISHLKELQENDGGWENGWVCSYGRSKKRIGNRGVVTAFAIKALEQDGSC